MGFAHTPFLLFSQEGSSPVADGVVSGSGQVDLDFLNQDIPPVKSAWGASGDAGVVDVIIQPILEAFNQHVLWPVNYQYAKSQNSLVYAAKGHHPWLMVFILVLALQLAKEVFKPLLEHYHKMVEVAQFIVEGDHPFWHGPF